MYSKARWHMILLLKWLRVAHLRSNFGGIDPLDTNTSAQDSYQREGMKNVVII